MLARNAVASLALLLAASAAAQRIEFERKSFDRSRFERAGPAAAQPQPPPPTTVAAPDPAPAPASTAPTAPANPEFSFSAPATNSSFSPSSPAPGAGAPQGFAAPDFSEGMSDELKTLVLNPKLDLLPSKPFTNPREHDAALEIQKQTGACMFLYFKNTAEPKEKGLCNWFERDVSGQGKWRRAMRNYVQFEVTLPGTDLSQQLAAKYRVVKTPTLLVLKPGATQATRLNVFKFAPGKQPEIEPVDSILESLKASSTAPYQRLF